MNNVKIIAEAGVNHNGKEDLAIKLIDEAVESGADVIKFQLYNSSELTVKNNKLAKYQIINLKKKITQYEMLKKYEFGYEEFKKIIKYCKQKKIKFLASAFDIESIKLLHKLKVDTISDENKNRVKRLREKITLLENEIKKIENNI